LAPENQRPWTNLGTERIKAFSDGVFSIVITLLVLELHVPVLESPSSGSELMWALVAIWPKILTYAASFIVVGIYWIAHHNFFHYTHRTNRALLWLNNFYLMSVSLIAFTAGLIGSYPGNKVAVFFYGLNLVMVGIFLSSMWAYVMKHGMVNEHGLLVMRATRVIVAIPVALYSLAMLAAFVDTRISVALFVLVPLIYVTPGALEWVLEKSARAEERRP
jgi:uncharacterized membrane protein